MEEKSKLARARMQKETAYKIVIKYYAYLVGHIDAIRIFPHLVTSRLVEQDFRQHLDCKQTDKAKMMALLLELTRSTEETWFDGFTNVLSKVPQYEKVANSLMKGDSLQCARTHLVTLALLASPRPPRDCNR